MCLKTFIFRLTTLSLLSFTCLCVPLCCSGQDEKEFVKDGIGWGVRAGVSISKFGNTQPHLRPRYGFYLGGVIEYPLAKWVTVLVRPGYNQYGGNKISFEDESTYYPNEIEPIESESETSVDPTNDLELRHFSTSSLVTVHALELPLIVRFGHDLEEIRLFANAGVSSSYQVWVSESFDRTTANGGHFSTSSGTTHTTKSYQPFQTGIVGGLGILFDVGEEKRMAVEINYQYGLTPIKKSFSYIGSRTTNGDLYADSFSIGLEFMF